MKISIMSFFLLVVLSTANLQAQEITVSQFDFATAIENRGPVGIDSTFAPTVGTVYCFTRIEGITDTTQITHEWYHKDEEKASIGLTVASDNWRTWSSKTIPENWTGPWRVMVVAEDGNVLATKSFVITGN